MPELVNSLWVKSQLAGPAAQFTCDLFGRGGGGLRGFGMRGGRGKLNEDYLDPEHEQFRKLFCGGLSYETTTEGLKAHFETWGEIVDCVVMKEPKTKKSRGFGFITYKEAAMLDEAQKHRPHKIDGREIETKRAMPREESGRSESQQSVTKLFIGGCKDDTTEEHLRSTFEPFGEITKIDLITDRTTGKTKGFSFVTFKDYDSVDICVLKKKHELNGRSVEVKKAENKDGSIQGRGGVGGMGGMGGRGGMMGGVMGRGNWGGSAGYGSGYGVSCMSVVDILVDMVTKEVGVGDMEGVVGEGEEDMIVDMVEDMVKEVEGEEEIGVVEIVVVPLMVLDMETVMELAMEQQEMVTLEARVTTAEVVTIVTVTLEEVVTIVTVAMEAVTIVEGEVTMEEAVVVAMATAEDNVICCPNWKTRLAGKDGILIKFVRRRSCYKFQEDERSKVITSCIVTYG